MSQETEPAAADTESRGELTQLLHEAVAGPGRPRLKRGLGLIVAGVVVAGGVAVGVGALTDKPSGHGSALADSDTTHSPTAPASSGRPATSAAVTAHARNTEAGSATTTVPTSAATEQAVSTVRTSPASAVTTAAAQKKAAAANVRSAATTAVSGNQILGIGSGLCISPTGGGSGAQLELADCSGAAAEVWQIGSDGTMRSQGMCMDLDASGGLGNGTPVIRASCDGGGDQIFDLNSSNDLTSTGAGDLCVDATNQGTTAGTLLQLWTCGGTDNQKWKAVGS